MPGHKDPREALVRAAFRLQGVSNAIGVEHEAILRTMFDDIVAQLARIDPTAVGAMSYRRGRVAKLMDEVERVAGERWTEWHRATRNDMARLGRAEALQTRADIVATLGDAGAAAVRMSVPTQNMMKAILDRNPFNGETLEGWVKKVQAPATVRRVRQQIQIGMMGEESIDDMVRRVRGRSIGRGRYTGGVMGTTTREARAVVRTAVTDIAAEARIETFRQSPNVVKAVQWVSALDTLTCIECGDLDGETWPLGDTGHLIPPAHINCRCSLVPELDWDGLGLEQPEPGVRAARDADKELAGAPRSTTTTQVSADTTYSAWFRDQTAAVQNEIMGPGRAKIFRSGGLRLDQLIGRDGRLLTLEELERML